MGGKKMSGPTKPTTNLRVRMSEITNQNVKVARARFSFISSLSIQGAMAEYRSPRAL